MEQAYSDLLEYNNLPLDEQYPEGTSTGANTSMLLNNETENNDTTIPTKVTKPKKSNSQTQKRVSVNLSGVSFKPLSVNNAATTDTKPTSPTKSPGKISEHGNHRTSAGQSPHTLNPMQLTKVVESSDTMNDSEVSQVDIVEPVTTAEPVIPSLTLSGSQQELTNHSNLTTSINPNPNPPNQSHSYPVLAASSASNSTLKDQLNQLELSGTMLRFASKYGLDKDPNEIDGMDDTRADIHIGLTGVCWMQQHIFNMLWGVNDRVGRMLEADNAETTKIDQRSNDTVTKLLEHLTKTNANHTRFQEEYKTDLIGQYELRLEQQTKVSKQLEAHLNETAANLQSQRQTVTLLQHQVETLTRALNIYLHTERMDGCNSSVGGLYDDNDDGGDGVGGAGSNEPTDIDEVVYVRHFGEPHIHSANKHDTPSSAQRYLMMASDHRRTQLNDRTGTAKSVKQLERLARSQRIINACSDK